MMALIASKVSSYPKQNWGTSSGGNAPGNTPFGVKPSGYPCTESKIYMKYI